MLRYLPVLIFLIALALPASPPKSTLTAANEFAAAYAEWTKAEEAKIPDTYDVTEARAWKQVEDKFSPLRKQMKLEHSY